MLCVGFSLCYVQFAVTNLVASLRACLASLAWLASLAAGASRPQDPLRTENSHAVTAASGHLTFAPRSDDDLIWPNHLTYTVLGGESTGRWLIPRK